MDITGTHKPPTIRVWLLAARPKTLPAGIVPVLAGGALAYGDGGLHGWSVAAALICSILIQIGTNLTNDLFDFRKNTDTAERTGPVRVTQSGMVTPRQIAAAIAVVFALAVTAGTYLVFRGGWPIVVIGLVSILCGVLYTAGPWALAYIGLGDLFVLIFYGPVALAGTYYVQTLTLDWRVALAGLPFGLISTAILVVNNLRDIDSDRKAGKNTLAVRYGRSFARLEYTVLIVAAALLPPVYMRLFGGSEFLLLPLLYLVPAAPAVAAVWRATAGAVLNRTLAATGRLLIVFGVLFCAGWLL